MQLCFWASLSLALISSSLQEKQCAVKLGSKLRGQCSPCEGLKRKRTTRSTAKDIGWTSTRRQQNICGPRLRFETVRCRQTEGVRLLFIASRRMSRFYRLHRCHDYQLGPTTEMLTILGVGYKSRPFPRCVMLSSPVFQWKVVFNLNNTLLISGNYYSAGHCILSISLCLALPLSSPSTYP